MSTKKMANAGWVFGIAAGAGLGIAFDNISMGIAFGVAFAVIFSSGKKP
ncbi:MULTISPECIES: hypothetical protein [Metabacillus]|nr:MULTISPECIES: hypothetical protein [Metabacillus]